MIVDFSDARRCWLEWMRGALQGPRFGDSEELSRSPLEYYGSGIMAPDRAEVPKDEGTVKEVEAQVRAKTAGAPNESHDEVSGEERDSQHPPPQSSIGLTFLATSDVRLDILVRGATYQNERGGRKVDGVDAPTIWRRTPFEGTRPLVPPSDSKTVPPLRPIADPNVPAEILVRWRTHGPNRLVTVSLVNRSRMHGASNFAQELARRCFFQTSLVCATTRGRILPYPRLEGVRLSEEEEEIELQYCGRETYALGHGVAADWTTDASGAVTKFLSLRPQDPRVPRRFWNWTSWSAVRNIPTR